MAMDWQVVYMLLVLSAMFALAGLVAHAWQFRRIAAAPPFYAFCISGFGWALCIALMAVVAPEHALFWLQCKYLFIGLTPVGAFLFVLAFTGRTAWLAWPRVALLLLIPLLTQLIVWRADLQPLMLQKVQFARLGSLSYISQLNFGPYYWLFTGYCYTLIFSSVFLVLASFWRSGDLLHRQGGFIVLGLLLPLLSNVLLITGIVGYQYDPLPVGLALSAGMFWLAMLRHRLFSLLPVVRNRVLDSAIDGILVLDTHGQVLDSNRALRRITGLEEGGSAGRTIYDCFVQVPEFLAALPQALAASSRASLVQFQLAARDYELSSTTLTDDQGHVIGHTVVLHDISDRLVLEASLRERNRELEEANQALDEVSRSDPLTGLRNRRFVMQQIDRDLHRCNERYQAWQDFADMRPPEASDLIVFLLDLDHFKRVNDQHGHAAGDEVLRQVRGRLQRVFREDDYLVRWGGEEFLIVARQVDRELAPQLAERLRLAFNQDAFTLPTGDLVQTCSVGFACYPFLPHAPQAVSWHQVIDLADQALYLAKTAERNTWRGLQSQAQVDQQQLHSALAQGIQHALQAGLISVVALTSA